MMKLSEILDLAERNILKNGDKFIAVDIPIDLIIEYEDGTFIYNRIMSDTESRKTVTLCSGELNSNYERY